MQSVIRIYRPQDQGGDITVYIGGAGTVQTIKSLIRLGLARHEDLFKYSCSITEAGLAAISPPQAQEVEEKT
jgi:hypothetical protein